MGSTGRENSFRALRPMMVSEGVPPRGAEADGAGDTQQKINDMLRKIREGGPKQPPSPSPQRPQLNLGIGTGHAQPRPRNLVFAQRQASDQETERRLREITTISGNVTIDGVLYKTDVREMEDVEELGNGTCGHVVKMRHGPSGRLIAVKQMRRSGNTDENKRIIMDIEVVLKSHDCPYIVQCLGCFINEAEVWICMELMDTCFDKLLRRLGTPIPESILGKVTVATVEALSYLKDKHGVIHRDVKPSNILLDSKGNVKLCDFGISGRLVDSMAKTRSAGCAAYMAPERIEPDPQSPDYDVRADVWSLGISLVEMATGVFPYQDCKTDFEVLTKVIGQEPPRLPSDKGFSKKFSEFVACCLIKEKKHRPKYAKLKAHPFIREYEAADVNVGDWYRKALALPEVSPPPPTTPRPVRQVVENVPVVPRRPWAGGERLARRPWPPVSPQPQVRSQSETRQPPGNTSPIVLQRFYHQQKQQHQLAKENEEAGKLRFPSHIRQNFTTSRSRQQSPEPPPRTARIPGTQSPLALKRAPPEAPLSPALGRRLVSPAPPVPPPRRLSDSASAPGSPQQVRAVFRHTPELRRRAFPPDGGA